MKLERAGSNDVKKLIELIKSKFSTLSKVAFSGKYSDLSEKATAADVGALPLTGGTISRNSNLLLSLKNTTGNGSAALVLYPGNGAKGRILVQSNYREAGNQFIVVRADENSKNIDLLIISENTRGIYDYKTKTVKEIMVQGDLVKPTVKETAFTIKSGSLKAVGHTNNPSTDTDITEIIKKAYTGSEGMLVGAATNGMGYIVAQNFFIDCSLITDDERKLVQSFNSIRIEKANDTSDYPTLKPSTADYLVGIAVRGKNGYINRTVKMSIRSSDSVNCFSYELPAEFKNDDNSSNNLRFETKEWITLVGIDVKNR